MFIKFGLINSFSWRLKEAYHFLIIFSDINIHSSYHTYLSSFITNVRSQNLYTIRIDKHIVVSFWAIQNRSLSKFYKSCHNSFVFR